ncbi:hypothetical protein SteCoe_35010 [Stentor coeruleus]|uniref:G-protein coupled receptors family 1 profile domain-containing protein n=1 Tax=Stentor coeruleus TaxID=5963 RepID=A0A1R2ATB3_9CILI|nr:hypothetical protein SteCoe_35010 [Stentor coeruleus]
MHLAIRIFIIIGSCLGFISSTLVIIELCWIKYKDLASLLIFFLMITDIVMELMLPFILYLESSYGCLCSIIVGAIFKQLHKYIIFFIAYSMYHVIVKEKNISFKIIICYLIFAFTLSAFIGIVNAIILTVEINEICIMSTESNTVIYYISLIWEYFSDFVVLVSLYFFYMKIKNILKKEAENCNLKSARKRIFAKRLFGYCAIFGFYILPYLLGQILYGLGQVKNTIVFQELLWLAYSWYPLLDSMIYGFTKSFKKNIFNCIWKSPDFDTIEETLQILREENILRPRFYLDMIEESEINFIIKLMLIRLD